MFGTLMIIEKHCQFTTKILHSYARATLDHIFPLIKIRLPGLLVYLLL